MVYIFLGFLLFLSAFFSSLETGLLSFGEVNIRKWANERMKVLNIWIHDPTGVITGILFGNNLVNITFSSIFTIVVVHFIHVWNIPETLTETVSIVCSSFLILILGEIIPKTFANAHPDKVISVFFGPFTGFFRMTRSIVKILNRISFAIVGGMPEKEKVVSRKELQMAVEEIEKSGILEKDSSKMLERVFSFARKTVGEIMVPRENILAVDLSWEYERIMEALLSSRYSRIPVYLKKLDNLTGLIYIKDVIGELNRNGRIDFDKILRKAYITYPGRNCHYLFHELRKKRTHCAIVKSGKRVEGIVTIEDLIEELVGEIYDEYDYRVLTD
jgi:CBS domain containing-hemolysin-like protein